MEVGKDSKFTFSLETLISISVTIFMVVGLWFNLQADIQEAKELPEPPVSRTEYDLNHAWMLDHVKDLEQDVKDLRSHVEDLQKDLYSKKDR